MTSNGCGQRGLGENNAGTQLRRFHFEFSRKSERCYELGIDQISAKHERGSFFDDNPRFDG